jgi:hypothetical protein
MSYRFNLLKAAVIALPLALAACGDNSEQGQASKAAMSQVAQKYDGKIVRQPSANRGKDDGWYFVKDGKRSWISDGAWLAKNGYQASSVTEISSADFTAIPEDPMPLK